MRLLYEDNLEDLALGAGVLGTGGGGDPYLGKLMAREAVRAHGPVKLIDLDELNENDLVVPTAMMGAPTVLIEKLPSGAEIVNTLHSVEKFMGRPAAATMSLEIGGMNSIIPVTVAASLGLPLLDADAMGRAFPEIQMVTYTIHGISATPMAMADEKGNSAALQTINNTWTETFARTLTIAMGATAMIALYPATAGQLRQAAITGSISLAERIGQTIRQTRAAHGDVVAAVREAAGAFELFRGKITDIARQTVAGFARGEATLAGIEGYSGDSLKIQFQNEFLIALRNERVVASVPDLITILDAETGEPVTTEKIRYGFRVVVLGIPSHPQWRTTAGLALVGPRYFGYDVDFVPVETRAATA